MESIIQSRNNKKLPLMLILTVLFFKFIPIPPLGGLGVAPENFVYLFTFFYFLINIADLKYLNRKIYVVIMLLLIFFFFEFTFNLFQGESIRTVVSKLKLVFFMLFVTTFCATEKCIIKVLKFFVILSLLSVIFGFLVYFIGEPFTSIRQWLTAGQSTSETIIIRKGSQLTGIYCVPHVFGYLMAVLPVICLSLFMAEKKFIWGVGLFVASIGLLLNAERSALLLTTLIIGIIIWRQKQRIILFVTLFLCVFLTIIFQNWFMSAHATNSFREEASYRTGSLAERMKSSSVEEFIDRIKWQLHGVRTVLKHPFIGATQKDYAREVYSDNRNMIGVSSRQIKTVLAPHNHYVNVGIKAGIWGWLILAALFWQIGSVIKSDFRRMGMKDNIVTIVLGLKLSVIAVLGNAVFHNAGIFSAEFASTTVLALLLALYGVAQSQQQERTVYATY